MVKRPSGIDFVGIDQFRGLAMAQRQVLHHGGEVFDGVRLHVGEDQARVRVDERLVDQFIPGLRMPGHEG